MISLPPELILSITDHLSFSDKYALLSTCRALHHLISPRSRTTREELYQARLLHETQIPNNLAPRLHHTCRGCLRILPFYHFPTGETECLACRPQVSSTVSSHRWILRSRVVECHVCRQVVLQEIFGVLVDHHDEVARCSGLCRVCRGEVAKGRLFCPCREDVWPEERREMMRRAFEDYKESSGGEVEFVVSRIIRRLDRLQERGTLSLSALKEHAGFSDRKKNFVVGFLLMELERGCS